uniref:Protein phosphatase 1 regulatory subunit 35 C-terminal domain-containing protein n=1 Tax=Oryzias sinensis TaxID=183150 RepID=A0A8C7YF44_9TELE
MSFPDLLSPPQSPSPAPLPLPSSSVICCPELDLSVTSSPSPNPLHSEVKPQTKSARPQGAPGRRKNSKVTFAEPDVVAGAQRPSVAPALQPGRGRSKGRQHARRTSPEPSASNQDPSCLERAELNTTLALKAELQSLQEAEFDSEKALQETLQKSQRTKNLINARATEGKAELPQSAPPVHTDPEQRAGRLQRPASCCLMAFDVCVSVRPVVNISRSQLLFHSLVSVDVQQEQLLSRVLKERLHLPPTPTAKGPTLLFFKTSSLVHQKPLPQEEELLDSKALPSPRPPRFTFDLYRRQRCWEAAP